MKLIIAGGRDFSNAALMHNAMIDFMEANGTPSVVVCGMARGADALGRMWAYENWIPVKEFPADWDLHGKKAGPIRNQAMAEYADCAIVFWDGKSRGSADMIRRMREMKKDVVVVKY